jgi:hypothetical protein
LLSALLLCLAISFAGTAAFASHLRGTSVSWSPTGTAGTVKFTIQYSQRTSFGCPSLPATCVVGGTVAVPFTFGDGSVAVTVNATITSLNSAEDYLSATGTVIHTYSGAGPYTAFYQSSARVTTIKSGGSQNLRMETLVSPFANPVNHSPIASVPAIVTVPLQATTGFTVSAVDPDGDNLSFRLSTASEMYAVPSFSCAAQQPPGLSINNSGQVTWDTTKITAAGCGFSAPVSGDLWTVQFMVQDLDSSNNVKSKVPVDLIIKFILSTEAPPTLTLSNPGPITARPNTPLTFTVGSDDTTANSRVTLNVTGLPVGATNTNVNQTLTPPLSSTFSWTPTVAQAGSYIVTYTVTNDTFEQTLGSVTINVPSLLPPVASCPVSLTAQYNTAVSIPVQVSDPQGDALTVVWSADGSSVRTDNVAASTSASTLTLSQTFTILGPHTVSINATNSDNISSTCSTPISVTTADQVISFGALPNMTYGDSDMGLSATSTSGLSITFAATGSCSIVNGALHTTGPGSCLVTASQAGSTNYNAAPQVTQTFQIAQRPLTVTAQDATRQFGFANPTFTGTISGIANNDVVTATYSSTATTTSTVNMYAIVPTPAGAALSNYLVTITNGTLTVTKATGTLTAPTVSPINATFGTSVTLTQTVPAGETGTVTFLCGTTVLGTATISNGVASLTTSALPAGTDMLTGQASGDTNYSPATSPAVTDTVGKATPTLAPLSISPANAAFGTPVTLSQTVPAGETGTVTFYNGTTVIGTATIINGVATLTTSALPVGSDVLTAQVSGDANYAPQTGPQTTNSVGKAASTLAAPTVSPMNSPYGTSVTITQIVPSDETGTVTFYNGTTVIGTAPIIKGVATLTTTALPAGSASITAQTSGDTNYAPATTAAVNDTVSKVTPTLASMTLSPQNAAFGTPVTLTQTVPAGETGTVTFLCGTTVLGTATISNGVASLTTSALPAGTDMLTGQASGDTNFNAATSPGVSDLVGKATPTLAPLSISPANAAFGTPVTLSQTVPAGETGTVTFYNGTTVIGTATIINGVATLTTSALPVGNDFLTAQVSGDANYAPQTGPQTTDSVGKAASTLAAPTVSPMNSPYGSSVTLTQIVPADETGTVTFYNGTTVIGTATIIKGVATLTTTALPAGSDSITAQTSGDISYAPATTAAVNDTVSKVTPTLASMTLSPQNAAFGTPVTLTQSVPATETGTVTFYNGTTPIGTATISNGVATLITTALPAGPDSISAQVSGDSNYDAVTGAAILDTVGPAPVQVTLTATSTTLNPNQPVTFTATLASVGGTPSGTVQFFDGSTLLGTATLTGGVATFTTTLPAGSTNLITVQYPGSPVSATAQGNTALTVVVGALDFGYALATGSVSTQTVNVGAATSYNLTVSPLYGGFPGAVTFAVTGLPPGATYNLSPSTLQASSTGSSQVLTVQTSTAVASTSDLNLKSKIAPILLGMLILPLAGSRRMRKSGNRIARNGLFCLLLILGAGAMAGLTGCGTSNGVFHQGQQSFTLTVTATSASISHSVTVTLNEQ